MNANALFNQYRNMIRKSAWAWARKFHMDAEEMEAQGNLIFVEALSSYDPTRGAQFGTHLFNQLKRLSEYCVTHARRSSASIVAPDVDFEYELVCPRSVSPDFNGVRTDNLTADSQAVLQYITSFDWHQEGRQKPSCTLAVRHFNLLGWVSSRVTEAWDELASWYSQGVVA